MPSSLKCGSGQDEGQGAALNMVVVVVTSMVVFLALKVYFYCYHWFPLSIPKAAVFHLAASSVTNINPTAQSDWPLCGDRCRHAACNMKPISRAFATCRDCRAEGHCARAVCHRPSQSPLEAG